MNRTVSAAGNGGLDRRLVRSRRVALLSLMAWAACLIGAEGATPREGEGRRSRAAVWQAGIVMPMGLPLARVGVDRPDPDALFGQLVRGGLLDRTIALDDLKCGRCELERPIINTSMPTMARVKVMNGFTLANERLVRSQECREMFEQLDANGFVLLATTIYLPSSGKLASVMCQDKGAAAHTGLGQPVTYVCPVFARLRKQDAAMSLLHEAMHYAGLPERPVHPGAMSSVEISQMVRQRCGL